MQKNIGISIINYKLFTGKYVECETIVKEYNNDGNLQFEGEYLNGKRNGKGKEYYHGKLIFEGEYLNGKKWNGKGKIYDFFDILRFECEYLNGEKKLQK